MTFLRPVWPVVEAMKKAKATMAKTFVDPLVVGREGRRRGQPRPIPEGYAICSVALISFLILFSISDLCRLVLLSYRVCVCV